MELWLCRKNQRALMRQGHDITVFAVTQPFILLERYCDPATNDKYVRDWVAKNRAVEALISGKKIPGDKKSNVTVRDFDTFHSVRVLSPANSERFMTFLVMINKETAYLEFYVDKNGDAHCRARTNETAHDAEGNSYQKPGYLIFDH